MRELFESGNITEVFYFLDDGSSIRVTMTKLKCFDIRKYDLDLEYYAPCFETSASCDWNEVLRYVKSLTK